MELEEKCNIAFNICIKKQHWDKNASRPGPKNKVQGYNFDIIIWES